MSTPMTVDRSPSFEPAHSFEYSHETATKEVWVCDGSCGQENCQEKEYFWK